MRGQYHHRLFAGEPAIRFSVMCLQRKPAYGTRFQKR